jgi:hypothetical protein
LYHWRKRKGGAKKEKKKKKANKKKKKNRISKKINSRLFTVKYAYQWHFPIASLSQTEKVPPEKVFEESRAHPRVALE